MNFNTLDEAIRLVKKKFNVDFTLMNCGIEQFPETITAFSGFTAHIKAPMIIKLELTVKTDHGSWVEDTDLEYAIFDKDIKDGSEVDKVIGGDLMKYTPENREVLRLAFIIYNGIKYGVDREMRKIDIDNGWHPRIVSAKMRF